MIFAGLGCEFGGERYLLPRPAPTDLHGDVAIAPVAGPVWPMKNWASLRSAAAPARGRRPARQRAAQAGDPARAPRRHRQPPLPGRRRQPADASGARSRGAVRDHLQLHEPVGDPRLWAADATGLAAAARVLLQARPRSQGDQRSRSGRRVRCGDGAAVASQRRWRGCLDLEAKHRGTRAGIRRRGGDAGHVCVGRRAIATARRAADWRRRPFLCARLDGVSGCARHRRRLRRQRQRPQPGRRTRDAGRVPEPARRPVHQRGVARQGHALAALLPAPDALRRNGAARACSTSCGTTRSSGSTAPC